MLFMGVVIGNALIGIVQEVRSKKKLDALALLNQQKAHVLRDGKVDKIPVDEIVENDLILLQAGDQICVDGFLVSGEVECNESLLTGEKMCIRDRLYINQVTPQVKEAQKSISSKVPELDTYNGKPFYQGTAFIDEQTTKRLQDQLENCTITPVSYTHLFL